MVHSALNKAWDVLNPPETYPDEAVWEVITEHANAHPPVGRAVWKAVRKALAEAGGGQHPL